MKNIPIYLEHEQTYYSDVDDTLVMWDNTPEIIDLEHWVCVPDPHANGFFYLRKHHKHIKLLKDHFSRGFGVIVWSAAGAAWAQAVVRALDLEDYVHLMITKPTKFVDDLPAKEVMGSRIYLKDTGKKSDEV